MSQDNTFGEFLRKTRRAAELTQEQLAERAEIDNTLISKYETGTYSPPEREILLRLADALGITGKTERLNFLLAAGRITEEDLEGFELVLVSPAPTYPTQRRRGALASPPIITSKPTTTGQKIDAILEEADLSSEEQETFDEFLIPLARQLAPLVKRNNRGKDATPSSIPE